MNMIEAIRICFSKYTQFEGRARRAEFWWFTLFLVVAGIGADLIDTIILGFKWGEYGIGPLNTIFTLATIIPAIAVGVRRLHDTDRSGWWHLLVLVPVIGWIVLIVWWATSGHKGDNRFGPDPL